MISKQIKEFEQYLYNMFIEPSTSFRQWVDKEYNGLLFTEIKKNEAYKYLKKNIEYGDSGGFNRDYVYYYLNYIDKQIQNKGEPLKDIYDRSGETVGFGDIYVKPLTNEDKETVLIRLSEFSKILEEQMITSNKIIPIFDK